MIAASIWRAPHAPPSTHPSNRIRRAPDAAPPAGGSGGGGGAPDRLQQLLSWGQGRWAAMDLQQRASAVAVGLLAAFALPKVRRVTWA